jgi:hypothetical protein
LATSTEIAFRLILNLHLPHCSYEALPDDEAEGSYANFSYVSLGISESKAVEVEEKVPAKPVISKVAVQASIKKKASVKPAASDEGNDDDEIPGLKDEDVAAKTGNTVSA